jgi:hypothetical protein
MFNKTRIKYTAFIFLVKNIVFLEEHYVLGCDAV